MKQLLIVVITVSFATPAPAGEKAAETKATPASRAAKPQPLVTDIISTEGSGRGTAYAESNKIITAKGKIFVGYLDRPAEVKVRTYDTARKQWSEPVLLGHGRDNHAGPALTMDSQGYLYAAYGPHHTPLQFRRSLKPYDASEWGPEEKFGVNCTYPSLVCGPDDTLHLVYRGGPDRWQVMYQQRPRGGEWTPAVALVDRGDQKSSYFRFGSSLAVAQDGTLHLGYYISKDQPFRGTVLGHLRSDDAGRTWATADGRKATLPVTPQSAGHIEQGDDFRISASNLVLDGAGRPWMIAAHSEKTPHSATLWHHDGTDWKPRDLLADLHQESPGHEFAAMPTLTFDKNGRLYIAAVIQEQGVTGQLAKGPWGHPSSSIILLTSTDQGKTFETTPIASGAHKKPAWLPSLERPFGPRPIGMPTLMFTHGGTSVKKDVAADIVFVQIREQRP